MRIYFFSFLSHFSVCATENLEVSLLIFRSCLLAFLTTFFPFSILCRRESESQKGWLHPDSLSLSAENMLKTVEKKGRHRGRKEGKKKGPLPGLQLGE